MYPTRFSSLPVLGLVLVLVAGCSTTPGEKETSRASHRAGAMKIDEVMRGFDEAIRKRVPGETDVHDRWEGVYASIADAAAQLEVSANTLAGHPPLKLELPDRARFQVDARTLADRAAALREAASSNDADAVSAARTELAGACRDCHSRFRKDAPGVPEAFR